jgi:hypothetical protein
MPCQTCPVRDGLDCLGTINAGACARAPTDAEFRASLVRRAEALAEGPAPGLEAMPRSQWPLGIALVAMLARPEDRGIGDTVARVVGPVGGDLFKAWYRRVTGQDCGCGTRQESLNATYPYHHGAPPT